ncbi:MAG: histidine kinase, partial [Lachnospiraceae bacterium]|nr:histidine kinase [Lachnospiraceae bacterium]
MNFRARKFKKKKLEWSMVVVLLLGWLLPLTLIAYIMLYFVTSTISSQTTKTIEMSTDKAVEICELHLAEAVQASKNATYISTIETSYHQYLIDGKGQRLSRDITNFLNQYYKYNNNYLSTMLFFLDAPEQIYYAINVYSAYDIAMTGYEPIQDFIDHSQKEIIELGRELGNETKLVYLNGRLFLIRNIVNAYYEPYAMLIIHLSCERIFPSLGSVWGAIDYEVYIDGTKILNSEIDTIAMINEKSTYTRHQNRAFSSKEIDFGKQKIAFLVELDSRFLIREVSIAQQMVALIIVFMLLLFYLIFTFFRKKVSKPISSLIDASRKIKTGDYGYQIKGDSNSEEFAFLIDAYNAMSKELEHQFQRIYLEELAVRDASILALQSQINPHFLNNTLEIINWEARLSGNDKVSQMIEALSTMLYFTMNRENKNYHTLSEELSYIDAYLYIIGQRFGPRFQVENDIDESLQGIEIPRLIVQPILENTVEHGMKDRKKANVVVRVMKSDGNMLIQIINDRKLTEDEKKKIASLLLQDRKDNNGSLGISNVNKRLKIIYGEN